MTVFNMCDALLMMYKGVCTLLRLAQKCLAKLLMRGLCRASVCCHQFDAFNDHNPVSYWGIEPYMII